MFENFFDFNGDGELDCFEQATEFMLFSELIGEDETDEFDEDDCIF